jgi:hypothetical protein
MTICGTNFVGLYNLDDPFLAIDHYLSYIFLLYIIPTLYEQSTHRNMQIYTLYIFIKIF